MQKISYKSQLEQLKSRNKPIILHFVTDWCNPCKLSRKLLQNQCSQSHSLIVVAQVNCQQAEQLVLDYNIEGVPTILVFDNNLKIINRAVGFLPQRIHKICRQVLP